MAASKDKQTFFRRNRVPIIVGGILVIAVIGLAAKVLFGEKEAPRKSAPIVSIKLPPPPPPPPPPPTPPPPPPPQEEKMVEQTPVDEPEEKEEPKPDEPPPVGTNLKGDGPADGFGLGSGNGTGGRGIGGGSARSKWGWYASQVQAKVVDAASKHPRVRSAQLVLKVRIWVDSTGRVTRAKISGSSGNGAIDSALQNEILTGLQLPEPPPEGMPMPIVMRISAKRPI